MYVVIERPFGDEYFYERVVASCRERRSAQGLIDTCSGWHTYRIECVPEGSKPKLEKGKGAE